MQCRSCGREFSRSRAPGLICENCWDKSRGRRPHHLHRPPKLRPAPEQGPGRVVLESAHVSLTLIAADEPTEAA